MSEELKPCPFCGGTHIRFDLHRGDREVWSMCCYDCGATFPNCYKKELLVECWNRRPAADESAKPFQARVQPWMMECFGAEIAGDRMERNHRFFEESTETVQANGMTRSEAHQLVDYTYDRPAGELHQEIGGVMVTLAALCLASGQDMHAAGETELARIWTKVDAIRAKQAAKPRHSPLPAHAEPAITVGKEAVTLSDEEIVKYWLETPRGMALSKYHGVLVFARAILAQRDASKAEPTS